MNTCETPIESAHLKLHDVATVHNENDITSQYNDVILISEYVQSADNTTILACVGGKTKLEHFSIHVFGSNYSSNSNAYYNEVNRL